jgi:iron complex outermembrane receptor protein
LRADLRQVTPAGRDTNKAGVIRPRRFSGGSGSVMASWRPRGPLSVRGTLLRTFQAPSVEHLFAEGPHLAAYSYETGNADLGAESGSGLNLSVRIGNGGTYAELSGFHNRFGRYLYSANTGQLEVGPGAEGLLARYQFRGAPATLSGGELQAAYAIDEHWTVEANGSTVIGTLTAANQPLPAMPPLRGTLGLRWERSGWRTRLAAIGVARQSRTGEFESPTASHLTTSASVEWASRTATRQVTVTVTADNLFDTEYRDHLSRLKSIMPEAGRSLRVGLQMSM